MADVVVVGAGIVGASVAYHAARVGARVTLVDRSEPGSGVTQDSFAWIGGPRERDVPDASTPVRRTVLADHRRLEAELPGVRVRWTGSLTWGDGTVADDAALGPDEHRVDAAAARRLEPALRDAPDDAVYASTDGAVDPVAVTRALVGGVVERGGRLVRAAVTGLTVRDDGVVGVETSVGPLPAGTVVLAAGTGAPALCAPLGVDLPVRASPAVLLRFTAPPALVRTLVVAPGIEVRQAADGHLLVAAEDDGRGNVGLAQRTMDRLHATFAVDAGDLRPVSTRVGARPLPADGLPVVGPLPGVGGLYLTVMHSGVTLAPAVGRLVAAEVVAGAEAAELSGLRPARFALAGG